LAVLVAGGLVGCEVKKVAPPPVPPTEVLVTTVVQRDVPIYSEWIGTLDGYVNAAIRAQVTGYIMRQAYKDGDLVHKGDLLFQIDPRLFQATLDQRVAEEVKSALDVGRLAPLAKESAVTQTELDNAVQQNLADKAAVESARLNLEFTKIIAPIDGVAGIANVQVGDLVGPASPNPLTTVSTMDPIKVDFNVSEQEYLRYTKHLWNDEDVTGAAREKVVGRGMDLILANGAVYPRKGRFFSADRQVNIGTGTLRLTGIFPNPGNILRPGQYALVRAEMELRKGALLVPQRAVLDMQGISLVTVVGPDNKAESRPVETAERVGSQWIITDGLKPGETIVVQGYVKSGATVAPKPWTEAVKAPAAKPEPAAPKTAAAAGQPPAAPEAK
jgi:membrane fusion protein (multidrug efflux system)